jgi:nucleotide-binding universal stress UspA family protein
LIILGSHGAKGLREYFLGSNAEKIIRTSPVPVLVVKGSPSGTVKNIVFPNTLDTQHQTELIQRVKALQKFFGAHLHIVYINTPDNFTSDKFTHERLEAFVRKFSFKDFTTSIYNHHYEDEGIIQFTEKVGAEMIAMGTHGHKGLSHFVTGSMAEDVTNHVKAMIWTFVTKPRSKK